MAWYLIGESNERIEINVTQDIMAYFDTFDTIGMRQDCASQKLGWFSEMILEAIILVQFGSNFIW